MRRWAVSSPSPSRSPHPVISNTTPLISLVGVGLLDLLPAIYGEVWIPEAVYAEYQTGRAHHPGSPDLDTLSWVRVHPVTLKRYTASPSRLVSGTWGKLLPLVRASLRKVRGTGLTRRLQDFMLQIS